MTIEKLRKLVVEEGTDDGHVTVPNCKELLRHERNKVLDEAIEKLKPHKEEIDDSFIYAMKEAISILKSLKL